MSFPKITTFILAFFTIGHLWAQDFSIGPKVGFTQGSISVNGDNFQSQDPANGYHVGLFVRMGGNSIFVQPEFLYSNTGGSFISTNDAVNENTYTVSFDRFDIPLMAGVKLANFFRVQGGPIASFILNSEFTDKLQQGIIPDYNSATLGFQAGIGFDIKNVILDFKYEGGLSKMADRIAGLDTDQRQNMLIVSVGFRMF
ncbi:porin family protein [Pararhodonellum marinum]|uniref:porin family protein n=1 Tax=Pararhodonellum marinum TaxID=2755358 RepID=UPI0018905F67|nr:porin family protein [Pararhodonellum marinum]